MKTLKNTTITIIESGIEESNNFKNNILKLFKEEFISNYYNQYNVSIDKIALWDVSFGNTGYGRFRRAGRGIQLVVEGNRPSDDGELEKYEETINISETIDSSTIDFLYTLEYGSKSYSDEMKRIALKLIKDEIDDKISEAIINN